MPRGIMHKVDILARVLRMKRDLGPISSDYKKGCR